MIAQIAGKIAMLLCMALAAWPAAAQTRFIPLQLIIGDRWNGEESITYPSGRFVEGASIVRLVTGCDLACDRRF